MNPEPSVDASGRAEHHRRKRSTRRWWMGTIAAVIVISVAAGRITRNFLVTILCFDGLLALALSLRLAIPVFLELGRRDSTVEPISLEQWMPLQGRWLRILLATPGMLIVLTMFWATIFTVLATAEGAIGWLIIELAVR